MTIGGRKLLRRISTLKRSLGDHKELEAGRFYGGHYGAWRMGGREVLWRPLRGLEDGGPGGSMEATTGSGGWGAERFYGGHYGAWRTGVREVFRRTSSSLEVGWMATQLSKSR
jgi:hypothetical protein